MAGSASLRGASADALASLVEDLRAALGAGTDAARVGDDLFSAAVLLHRESGLRRTATDASLDPHARSGLLRQVLDGKVDPVALDLVATAVTKRWTSTRDLGVALEHLAVVAVVRSADDGGRLSDELFAAARIIRGNAGLRDALADPTRSTDDKSALVQQVFGSRTLPATTTLLTQSLAGSHRTVGVALDEYQRVAADVHAERVAVVRVASDLADGDRERLRQALARQYGREVHLNVLVDPSVLGGVRVEIGDDVIDGTVSARLDEARRTLVG